MNCIKAILPSILTKPVKLVVFTDELFDIVYPAHFKMLRVAIVTYIYIQIKAKAFIFQRKKIKCTGIAFSPESIQQDHVGHVGVIIEPARARIG